MSAIGLGIVHWHIFKGNVRLLRLILITFKPCRTNKQKKTCIQSEKLEKRKHAHNSIIVINWQWWGNEQESFCSNDPPLWHFNGSSFSCPLSLWLIYSGLMAQIACLIYVWTLVMLHYKSDWMGTSPRTRYVTLCKSIRISKSQ